MAESPSSNPFVLPGLGQSGDMASNPLFASLEMMRQTFATMSGANGLAQGMSLQPSLDPAELEKKINELKSVESWLKLNLSMLSSTIQGMEVQLATITTLRQFVATNHLAAQNFASAPAPVSEKAKASPPSRPDVEASAAQTPGAPEAAQAWWNMLTQQFGQLAAATTASMKDAPTPDATSENKASAPQASSKNKVSAVQKSATKRPTKKTLP